MLEITTSAAAQLRTLISNDPSRSYLRLYVAGRTCCSYRYGLAFDEKTDEGDQVVEVAGIGVAVDPESSPHCDGATIDFITNDTGSGFVVRGVKAAGGCTCGRS